MTLAFPEINVYSSVLSPDFHDLRSSVSSVRSTRFIIEDNKAGRGFGLLAQVAKQSGHK